MTTKSARTTLTVASILPHCQHRTASGRRCRLAVAATSTHFCTRHIPPPAPPDLVDQNSNPRDTKDCFVYLSRDYDGFQTAQGINHSLNNLFELLSRNAISPRRAAVLAYISSLLLRTLPQIDADTAAGIKIHPKNKIVSTTPSPAEPFNISPCAPISESETHAASDSPTDSISTDAWAPFNPEPDPNKKPS